MDKIISFCILPNLSPNSTKSQHWFIFLKVGTASEPTTTSQPGSQLISSPENEESKSNGDAIVQTNGGDSGNGMSESENQNKNGPAPLDMVNGNGKLDGIKAVKTKSDDNLSEFDKIKMRAQKAAKNLDVEKEKKSRPSKSLSKYLESQKDPEPVSKKIRIEKPKLKDVNSPAKKVTYKICFFLFWTC